MDDYKYLFKIVLVGNAGVGKTCLVRQFTHGGNQNVNNGHQGATIGVDFMIKTVVANGMKIKLQLWDTAGQERFRSITQSYYRSAHCLILVYDISSQPSFDALSRWIKDVDAVLDRDIQSSNNGNINNNNNTEVLRVLVGNKCDKEREIPYAIGEKFANINKFDLFMETLALDNESVDKLFYDIAEMLAIRKQNEPKISNNNNSTIINGQNLTLNNRQHSNENNNNTMFGSINALNLTNRARTCFQC